MATKTAEPAAFLGATEEANGQWAVRQLTEALRGLQFGQITVTVQDGVVVQVERTERHRFVRQARK
jgi:hypothetical protein